MSTFLRLSGILVAIAGVQVTGSAAVLASANAALPVNGYTNTVSLLLLQTDLEQFVPPDTGGPDQTQGTGTR